MIKEQTYDLPTAFSVALLQKFTVKTILNNNYKVQILVGSNNIYRVHDIQVETSDLQRTNMESTCVA